MIILPRSAMDRREVRGSETNKAILVGKKWESKMAPVYKLSEK